MKWHCRLRRPFPVCTWGGVTADAIYVVLYNKRSLFSFLERGRTKVFLYGYFFSSPSSRVNLPEMEEGGTVICGKLGEVRGQLKSRELRGFSFQRDKVNGEDLCACLNLSQKKAARISLILRNPYRRTDTTGVSAPLTTLASASDG